MTAIVKPYAKAFAALLGLLVTGGVLVLVGDHDAGVALIVAAPVTSGLVAGVRNVPKRRRR